MKLRLFFTVLCITGTAAIALHTWSSDTEAADTKSAAPAAAPAKPPAAPVVSTKDDWEKICTYRAAGNEQFKKKCLENSTKRIGRPLNEASKKRLEEAKQGKVASRPSPRNPNTSRNTRQGRATN